MSATNRGSERITQDHYPTPPWCVRRLLDRVGSVMPAGVWLEPCAGREYMIARTVDEQARLGSYPTMNWWMIDIQPFNKTSHDGLRFIIADYLTWQAPPGIACAISNPPYSLADPIIRKACRDAPVVAMLLRLNYLGSGTRDKLDGLSRSEWLRENPPSVYVLPNRPSFAHKITCHALGCKGDMIPWSASTPGALVCGCRYTDAGEVVEQVHKRTAATDATEYAWFVWGLHDTPRIEILDETPTAEREDRKT